MIEYFQRYLKAVLRGLRLRCPNCGQGVMSHRLFQLEKSCPVCGIIYERQVGESVGGMYINLGMAELLSVGGYLTTQFLFKPPPVYQVLFWIPFNIIFVLLFYRHSRAIWVAILWLNNAL